MDNYDSNTWYKNWFDSPYYHLLYKHRDQEDANTFIQRLFQSAILTKTQHVLDLCCGKGRHALTISQLGIQTTGVDLSKQSILEAKKHENQKLNFFQADMREAHTKLAYDIILNIFTSFGYFDNEQDHNKALQSCHTMLKPKGYVLIDYFNADWVVQQIQKVPLHQDVKRGDILFKTHKHVDHSYVYKDILIESISSKEKLGQYQEKVRLFTPENFHEMLQKNGFSIQDEFGNYHLEKFNKKDSERYIVYAQKSS